ncbi:MAG TPA: phosphatase PAP2 family protein [Solirubrobacterales bacterium]|nr:phosphatase PAP2 family protein [Solirubrobacterales bacterium]
MDWSLLHTLNDFLFHHDAVEDPLLAFVNLSEALFLGILVLICLTAHGSRYASWRRAAVAAGLSAGLGLAVAKVVADAVDRTRPFVADPRGVHLFSHHAADPGFPSDHATAAFAIAVAILLRKRGWGVVALIAAAVVSIGRVALGFHYPSDVLAGAALGAAAALVLWIPPIRAKVDALADLAGRLWDGALDWGAARLGLAWRA